MLITQRNKFVFLAVLFITSILVFAPISWSIGMDTPPEEGCNFIISSGPYYANEPITFTDTSNPPSGSIIEHLWDFNVENGLDNSVNPTHTFTDPGYYTINLAITMDNGKTYTHSETIEVLEQPIVEEPIVTDDSTPLDTPTETQTTELSVTTQEETPDVTTEDQTPQIDTTSTDTSTPITEEITVPQDTPVSDTQNTESGISPLEIIDLTISDILPDEIAATSEVASVTLPATLEGNSVQGISNEVDTQTQDAEPVTLAGSYAQATI